MVERAQRGFLHAKFVIATTDPEWAEFVRRKLGEIGLETTLHAYKPSKMGKRKRLYIYIKRPRVVTYLLKRYALDFLSPSRRKVVEELYGG